MADWISVDGFNYINEDELVRAMVKSCIEYTSTDDYTVEGAEREAVRECQSILNYGVFPKSFQEKFKAMYVKERFIRRTLGV